MPVIGWIVAGVIVAGVVIYLVTRDSPASAPGTQNQGPASAPGTQNEGPVSAPGHDNLSSGIDPVTGERLYTPANQDVGPMSAMPTYRGPRDDDEENPPPRRTPISDTYRKSELEDSGWLKRRIPDPERRRKFMKWLQRYHPMEETTGEEHPHLDPGSPEAEEMVEQFEQENPPNASVDPNAAQPNQSTVPTCDPSASSCPPGTVGPDGTPNE